MPFQALSNNDWPLLLLSVCWNVRDGREQSRIVWEGQLKGITCSFHMAASQESAGEFSRQTVLLAKLLVHKVAGRLWLDNLAQHHASLTLDCHQTASDTPLGKAHSCSLLKYSSYKVRRRRPTWAVLTAAPRCYRTGCTEKPLVSLCPLQALRVVQLPPSIFACCSLKLESTAWPGAVIFKREDIKSIPWL